jgi:DNA gyrase subunit B
MVDAIAPGEIVVLEGLEAVRRRPGMFVGDVRDGSGLHHLLWECVGNAVDEHLAGYAKRLRVSIRDREVTLEDDGRGIPVEPHTALGKSVLEAIFTEMHAGPTRFGHHPHVHVGWSYDGVGLAAVNALCARMEVEVRREGRRHRQAFERGRPVGPLETLGPCERSGIRLRFTPDGEIFGDSRFDRTAVRQRLRELACLNPDLTIRFDDEVFWAGDGLADFVRAVAPGRRWIRPEPVAIRGKSRDIGVECALLWCDGGSTQVSGFVCQHRVDEGSHVTGFWQALYRAFSGLAPDRMRGVFSPAFREVVGPGLEAAVHVTLYDPRFAGPTRENFTNPEARRAVVQVMTRPLLDALRGDGALRERLLARISQYGQRLTSTT